VWVCIFTRQSWILLAFSELANGYPHSCINACTCQYKYMQQIFLSHTAVETETYLNIFNALSSCEL
jgi:hypothetical protein